MPLYEHVFLARQDISTQQVEGLIETFGSVLKENGGAVAKTEYWGLKNLTYKIKKNRKAHFALMNIDAPPAAVAEMERQMGISTDVIRFLTVRVEEHETDPSPMMKRGDRDDRRGGRREGGFRDRDGGGFRDRDGGGFRDRDRDRDRDKERDGPRGRDETGERPARAHSTDSEKA